MEAVPDRQPDLPRPGRERGAAGSRGPFGSTSPLSRLAGLPSVVQLGGALAVAGAICLALAVGTGVVGVSAVPMVLRTGSVTLALFAVCGLPPAMTVATGELRPYRALLVLPIGAAVSALALALLGLLHLPLVASLAIVIAAGLGGCVAVGRRSRRGRDHGPGVSEAGAPTTPVLRVVAPLALAGLVGLVSLLPIFRSGFATVPGQNGDAILVVGTATLLEHAPPTATRTDLPIPRIPIEWRSKYPIYYPLAASAELAGVDPIQAFATVAAIMLALGTIGFYLFAAVVLRAPPWAALLTAFLVPLDRIVMYVTMHPYYNELWGQFTLPFMLLAGWSFLRRPGRAAAALFALFAVLGLLAYPLMFPFPVLFLGAFAVTEWRRRRRDRLPVRWISSLGLPRVLGRPWVWVPAVILAVPAVAVLGRGVLEKVWTAVGVLAPWTSLHGWSGSALGYIPWPQFVGLPGAHVLDYVGLAIICGLGVLGLRHVRDEIRVPLGVMIVATALIGVYFRVRTDGQLFYFKDLAFLGPYVLTLALVAVVTAAAARAAWRSAAGVAGIVASLAVVPNAAAAEINTTYDNATDTVLELRAWNREIPRGASVRVDVPPSGWQLWVSYMLTAHPMSAIDPLGGIFPHPPLGRKADYVIARTQQPRPLDAIGPPLLANRDYVLYRMSAAVPGPDVSTRALQYDVSTISIG